MDSHTQPAVPLNCRLRRAERGLNRKAAGQRSFWRGRSRFVAGLLLALCEQLEEIFVEPARIEGSVPFLESSRHPTTDLVVVEALLL